MTALHALPTVAPDEGPDDFARQLSTWLKAGCSPTSKTFVLVDRSNVENYIDLVRRSYKRQFSYDDLRIRVLGNILYVKRADQAKKIERAAINSSNFSAISDVINSLPISRRVHEKMMIALKEAFKPDFSASATRPLWKDRSPTDAPLSPPEFIEKYYRSDLEAGSLTQAAIKRKDPSLYWAYHNWRRDPRNKQSDVEFEFAKLKQPRDQNFTELYGREGASILEAQRALDRQRMRALRRNRLVAQNKGNN